MFLFIHKKQDNIKNSVLQLNHICVLLFIIFLNSILLESVSADTGINNTIYADLLRRHVKNGKVNYDGFKKEENKLDQYLAVLSRTDVRSLPENHQLAFYINVYNAFTIKLVLSEYPGINSIKEIGSFFSGPWSKKFIPLKSETVSLDHIEHHILRPVFKDPRIHFAINCASRSCPPLLDSPYEGDIINRQLDTQVTSFLDDEKRTFIREGTLYISKIFKWFKEDFSDNPMIFIRAHASDRLKGKLDSNGLPLKISYLEYDWSLNR